MIEYLSTADIAGWFGVTVRAVSQWMNRFNDFPQPDAIIGKVYGWLPEREAEIRAWHANRPPQGSRTDLRREP